MPSRNHTPLAVYLDGKEEPAVRVLSIRRGAGGRSLDTCTFLVDDEKPVANFNLTRGANTECEVVASLPTGPKVLHWGKVGNINANIGKSDARTYTSRMEHFHFGQPHYGTWERNPQGGNTVVNGNELVFNPQIDGVTENNRSPIRFADACYVIDPESLRSATAKNGQGVQAALAWNLVEAVLYLQRTMNGDSKGPIKNATAAELNAVLSSDDSLLKDFRIPNGPHLPEILDRLLEPFGYSWYVELAKRGERKLRYFKRGEGRQTSIKLQAVGQFVDPKLSNAKSTNIDYTIASAANSVWAAGDYRYVEGTFILERGWDASLEDLTYELSKDSEEYNDPANASYQRVWRDWVLNEGGDYGAAYDLSTLLGHPVVPRRRQFYPTITQGVDAAPIGETAGVTVEWSDDAGVHWHPLAEMTDSPNVHLLERECGIRFEGMSPPSDLMNAVDPDLSMVRVTASIRDDRRMTNATQLSTGSPLTDEATAFVDVSDRFHYREVSTLSKYSADVAAGTLTSKAVDDAQALATFSNQLRNAWDMADVSGDAVIEGLDNDQYEIGEVVTSLVGRGVNFSARAPGSTSRYPQVVAITWDVQGQQRTLSLQTFRDEVRA